MTPLLPEFPQDRDALEQMPKSALIDLLRQQQQVIEQLVAAVERLKRLLDSDSQTSSKLPSSDLIKRLENPVKPKPTSDPPPRRPGGQPGHPGKTRKGFVHFDRCGVPLAPLSTSV
ncbi:hypothetical protein KR51_00005340 [Rubidibacter lacunae KORDI 51-2]|uniref:DUF6444 domain-containing protein n=1 Tax=Rubidibacter lacunae KORDI 51-2 TaxID=582515 RepID=U5DPC2_9CHRO|nr:DUF6444 domain-containing protein [Rubidibacter lacunae]ERN42692.1 hypothetical protein KR51_00005340 [Rubidibacter lacunae KORDI 51-2]